MDLSKLRLNEINLDIFMKYFKDNYISNSFLQPYELEPTTKWFKYSYTDSNSFTRDFYSLYDLDLTPTEVGSENNLEMLNNYFSCSSINMNTKFNTSASKNVIKKTIMESELPIYICNGSYFSADCTVLYTPSKYFFILFEGDKKINFYNVIIDLENIYKDIASSSTRNNYYIELNNSQYIFNNLVLVDNENDAYYKDGINIYKLSNNKDVVGYLIENDAFKTNIDRQGRSLYKNIHGDIVIGNDTPTMFETHVNEVRTSINNYRSVEFFLKNNDYPIMQPILIDEDGELSFKNIDEVQLFTKYHRLTDKEIDNLSGLIKLNNPAISDEEKFNTLIENQGSEITTDEVITKYVDTVFSMKNIEKIKGYLLAGTNKLDIELKYPNNYLLEVYDAYPYIGAGNVNDENFSNYPFKFIYDEAANKYYLASADSKLTDKIELFTNSDGNYYFKINYENLSDGKFTVFNKVYSVTESYGNFEITTPEGDIAYCEVSDVLEIPVYYKYKYIDEFYCYINENNTLEQLKAGDYTPRSLKDLLYTTNYELVENDGTYSTYLLNSDIYRYLYDPKVIIECKKYAKILNNREVESVISADAPVKLTVDYLKSAYPLSRKFVNAYYNYRGTKLIKSDISAAKKKSFLNLFESFINNKEIKDINTSSFSSNYYNANYTYLTSAYNLFVNENRIYNDFILQSKIKTANQTNFNEDELNKIVLSKVTKDNVFTEDGNEYELKYINEYSLSDSDKYAIDKAVDEGNAYSRLLSYKKYSTINEMKENLYIYQKMDNIYNDYEKTRRYDDIEYAPENILKEQQNNRMNFKDYFKALILNYYENDKYDENGRSKYLVSFSNFYYKKIKNSKEVINRYNNETSEKLVLDLTNTNDNEIISDLIEKIITGEWVIL